MDTRELVRQTFDHALSQTFAAKPTILEFLLKHERRGLAIDNLTQQIRIAEFRHGIRFGRFKMLILCRDTAKMFATMAIGHAEQSALSSAERQRRIDESGKVAEFEAEQTDLVKWVEDNRPRSVLAGEAFERKGDA